MMSSATIVLLLIGVAAFVLGFLIYRVNERTAFYAEIRMERAKTITIEQSFMGRPSSVEKTEKASLEAS